MILNENNKSGINDDDDDDCNDYVDGGGDFVYLGVLNWS